MYVLKLVPTVLVNEEKGNHERGCASKHFRVPTLLSTLKNAPLQKYTKFGSTTGILLDSIFRSDFTRSDDRIYGKNFLKRKNPLRGFSEWVTGGDSRSRTDDPLLAKQVL